MTAFAEFAGPQNRRETNELETVTKATWSLIYSATDKDMHQGDSAPNVFLVGLINCGVPQGLVVVFWPRECTFPRGRFVIVKQRSLEGTVRWPLYRKSGWHNEGDWRFLLASFQRRQVFLSFSTRPDKSKSKISTFYLQSLRRYRVLYIWPSLVKSKCTLA